jgi:hypothetical protein
MFADRTFRKGSGLWSSECVAPCTDPRLETKVRLECQSSSSGILGLLRAVRPRARASKSPCYDHDENSVSSGALSRRCRGFRTRLHPTRLRLPDRPLLLAATQIDNRARSGHKGGQDRKSDSAQQATCGSPHKSNAGKGCRRGRSTSESRDVSRRRCRCRRQVCSARRENKLTRLLRPLSLLTAR